jgi:PTS system galactitol-specific IIC component
MENITAILAQSLAAFFSFKAYVILPAFMFVLALLARMPLKEAVLSTVKIAAGFAGVFIVFNFFVSQISPAVTAIIAVRHLDFPVVDVGWPPLAAITWSSFIAPIAIVAVMALNLVMLLTRLTKTLYVDLWNYWHFALLGALIQSVSASFPLALAATLTIALYNIKVTEWTAPYVKRETGLDAIAISPISVAGFLPYAVLMDRLFDLIPGFRRLKWDPSRAKHSDKGPHLLREPMVIGALVGVFLALMAGYDLKATLETVVNFAAVMFLLPRCGGLIGEGMGAVAQAFKAQVEKRFPRMTGLSIAMDTGILMTNPSVTATGLILIPLSVLIAFVLPGNRLIPLGDLPNLMSIMSVVTLVMGGNVVRAVLAGIPIVASFMLIASWMAPLFTAQAAAAGLSLAGDGKLITAFTDGGNQVRYWLFMAYQGNWVALAILPAVLGLLWFAWRSQKRVAQSQPGK